MDAASVLLPVAGLVAGIALGFVARRNFFCTLSALEQYWYAGESNGVRIWALAGLSAAILTQTAVAVGLVAPIDSIYLTPRFHWLGAVLGGIAFGYGMALVGTCGFGALVRLGGGSLKSLMAILVLAVTALSAMRGALALARTGILETVALDFSFAGSQSIPDIASALAGPAARWPLVAAILALGAWWVFRSPAFRADRKAVATGIMIGAVIAFGWLVTSTLSAYSFDPVQVESASFVAPVADTLLAFALVTGVLPDYGVGVVVGTVLGSALAARLGDDVRWEACDDARELSRHILGAALMGFGGIAALGCTIGQGVSAASLLTVSAPVTVASIVLGARMGLAWLLEGSARAAFRRL